MTETSQHKPQVVRQGDRTKGLKIERIYTTAGVHPYDEVTWERRDVVQQNWKTGETIFEQRGVDFPDFWSVNASTIVTTKYFRGAVNTDARETGLRQLIDRVVLTYRRAGEEHGYFASPADAEVFEHELTWALLHQVFSFNSPVWFNVGTSSPAQVSACFILAVDDTMDSILNWYREEGLIFKGGSGAGLNLSRIRSSKELLSSGGTASGPVSFMRGADASAGTIKSGGATRRAAKMVVLDVDHPDIVEFVQTKAREEDKIRALRDAGFDMDLGGKDITSVQYQNANNSVRVTDEFMRAVEQGTDFGLKARATGEVIDTVDARQLWRKIAVAAWECADPGIQYDDTINDWHTNPETGRITASNPCCFVGDTLVETTNGPVAIEQLVKSLEAGEDVTVRAYDEAAGEFVARRARRGWVAGSTSQLVDVITTGGLRLRSTTDHRYLTADGVWVKAEDLVVAQLLRCAVDGQHRVASLERVMLHDDVPVYDIEVEGEHNFVVTGEGISGVVVHNSEYMSLDNSSCNLASLNLLKFLRDDDTFDAPTFAKVVELVITAMDISICFADFPTKAIGDTTRKYRQLGIGYANLGALLMATGKGYDSEGGRALAASITSLMTGTSYKRSAELAGIVGPYEGYARNADAHKRVMRKHAAANDAIRTFETLDKDVQREANKAWDAVLKLGEKAGYRNAQASVLAPTGCLTGDTLVTTDRGLMRLSELGDVWGDKWQDAGFEVATDEGPKTATKFFVNGEEPTRRVVTKGGYRIQGTLTHRIKVVDPESGEWVWKRIADLAPEDIVPIQMGGLVGAPRRVPLPVLDQAYYAGDRRLYVPDVVDAELAELVGYFMGDGSLHAKGIRLCVADTDLDVVDRIRVLSKGLFGLEPVVTGQEGHQEVVLQSVRLARWWQAAGFANDLPGVDHSGKGWTPRVPAAIREANDVTVYGAFLRGVFEADGTVIESVPSVSTASELFADDIRSLLLALGLASTTRKTASGWGGPIQQVRLRNLEHALAFDETVGFMSDRKNALLPEVEPVQSGKRDLARRLHAITPDPRLAHALGYLFESVATNEDGGVQPTYDLSVPENVTYVANGFVSHNTIGFMMDCDTTGVEPDFSLVKFKKLVGGGSMQIVNLTIPRALRRLGYAEETVEAVVEYIAEKGHVIDAPGLRQEHYDIFDCAMGERAIAPMGHVRMMAAVQPFLSGAISKTINVPETATVEEIEDVHFQGWKLGLKALAVYRDNSKVGQPLSDAKDKSNATEPADTVMEKVVEYRPIRKRLPKQRPAQMTSFAVGGAEGYMAASSYPDDGLGEIFLKMSKQGSTLAGVMDAFSIAISIGLQYGVPLETFVSKFVNMRFEPAGLTDDPDVRMAQSIMDYVFRRLALDHLDFDTRSAYGVYSAEERSRQLETGSYQAEESDEAVEEELESLAQSAPVAEVPKTEAAQVEQPKNVPAGTSTGAKEAPAQAHSSAELLEVITGKVSDAPLCMTCGIKMRPAGSCYVCEGCGSTSGCS